MINTVETLHHQLQWLRTEFCGGRTSTNEAECSGRPKEVITPRNDR